MKKFFEKLLGSGAAEPAKRATALTGQEPLATQVKAGRIPLHFLHALINQMSSAEFCRYLEVPCLVGLSVLQGEVSSEVVKPDSRRRKTQLFIPQDVISDATDSEGAIKNAVYPLLTRKINEAYDVIYVGRGKDCELVIPDFAISEKHAKLVFKAGKYILSDLNSTNGTSVNGIPLKEQSVTLEDGFAVQFARMEYKFILPASLYRSLQEQNI